MDLNVGLRYALFAAIATVANILTQATVPYIYAGPQSLSVSIIAGTVVGFATKYLLDKRYIFKDRYAGAARELIKLALNGLFSVLTTGIFWVTELAFYSIWQTSTAKYSGAALGLSIGYVAKFLLDRNYTFHPRLAKQ